MEEKKYLKDFGGYQEVKSEIGTVIDYIKNYDKYISAGAYLPKGVILLGPSGTGKTELAKIIANETNVNIVDFNKSLESYKNENGDIELCVSNIFDNLQSCTKEILLIDDIDNLLLDNEESNNSTLRHSLYSKLDELDGKDGLFIVATASKNAEPLLYELTKKGRLDRKIYIEKPTIEDRKDILKIYLNNNSIFSKVDVNKLAKITNGLVGSTLKDLVNDVLLGAIKNNKEIVITEDFYPFIDEIVLGKTSANKNSRELKVIAYHEVGHFVCDYVLTGGKGTLSIQSHGDILGNYQPSEKKTNLCKTITDYENDIISDFGGMACTEVILKNKYNGGTNDILNANNKFFEMSKMGFMGFDSFYYAAFSENPHLEFIQKQNAYFDGLYRKTKEIIKANVGLINYLSKKLLEKITIYEDELEQLVNEYNSFHSQATC